MWEEPRNLALAGSGWQDGLCTSALVSLCERGDFLEWQMLEFETFYLFSSIPMALRLFTCRSYLTEGSSEELQGMYHPYQDSAERDVIFYLPSLYCRKSYLLSSQPRFWWGKTGQISGYFPGSQFPILLVQSLLEAPFSQTDLTSSPIWTLHFHKCHNNEAGDEVFKVSSLIIGLFIRTVLVADRKWVETRFVYYFFLVVTSLMLHISANMFCTFIYIYYIYLLVVALEHSRVLAIFCSTVFTSDHPCIESKQCTLNTWVVWNENCATRNREYSRVLECHH